MNQRTLYSTKFVQHAGLSDGISKSVKYIALNRGIIIPQDELIDMVSSIRNIINSPTAEIATRTLSNTSLSSFTAIDIPKNASVPEIIASTSVVLDTKCLEASTLSAIPSLKDKIILNLTSLITRNEYGMKAKVVETIQSLITRGQLCAMYHDDNSAFISYIGEYAVKAYSMIISNMIASQYSLDPPTTMTISAILALYYSQLMQSPDKGSMDKPSLYMRSRHIGGERALQEYADMFYEDSYKGLDLESMVNLIKKHGPARMSTFDMGVFKSMTSKLGPDSLSSHIAVEYPPYWIWILVLSLSGNKSGMSYHLNSNKLVNDGNSKFLHHLYTNEKLYSNRQK